MKRRDAFTITELLVLLPIIAMLGALLLASLDDTKQTVQAAACLSNMRQWGLAMGMYSDDWHDYIPYEGVNTSPIDRGYNLGAWFNILPHYINQTPLWALYDSTPPNVPLPGQRSIYVCPSLTAPSSSYFGQPSASNPWFAYAMNRLLTGNGGRPYTRGKAVLPGQVILLSESENNSYPFTDGYYLGTNGPPPLVPPRHSGGMNFVFVDGHAQWYSLADYGRSQPMIYGTSAQFEWFHNPPWKIYWFPCSTCNKP